jgi:hypothetical protein
MYWGFPWHCLWHSHFLLVSHHLSYDNFHPNKERAYRLFTEFHGEQINRNECAVSIRKSIQGGLRFAEKLARVASFENQNIITERKIVKIPGRRCCIC